MSLQSTLHILAVDDDQTSLLLYKKLMARESSISLRTVSEFAEAMRFLQEQCFDLLLIDLNLGDADNSGFELLAAAKNLDPAPECVVISSQKSFESVQRALRLGADDYIAKGFSHEEIAFALKKARERKSFKRLQTIAQKQSITESLRNPLIGSCAKMVKLRETLEKLARSDVPVFIQAETGTGKELVARQLHLRSANPTTNFVAVDCPNIPQGMAEAFLFGHERGAFTGADKSRAGIFEETDGGTLFLDEIGSLTIDMQSKLLRVLQEKEFCRLGTNRKLSVEFRLVSAANQDLEQLVASGNFKADLMHRLQGFVLSIPPLRQRKEDIFELCVHFLPTREFSSGLLELLNAYDWPGNVRELRNCIGAISALADPQKILDVSDLPEYWLQRLLRESTSAAQEKTELVHSALDYHEAKSLRERDFLGRAYLAANGNISHMARALKVDRSHLYQKLKSLGIHPSNK